MVATDHARTAKSRRVLKPFFGVGVPEKMGSGALSLRARVVNLKEEAPPQAGEHARHWGAVGRVLDQRVPRRRGAGVPKGTRSGRRESRVHAAQAGCSIMEQPRRAAPLWEAATANSCLRQKNFPGSTFDHPGKFGVFHAIVQRTTMAMICCGREARESQRWTDSDGGVWQRSMQKWTT